MDWTQYKALCDRADLWSRWMLEQTLELLRDCRCGDAEEGCARCPAGCLLRARLEFALEQPPLPKPSDHRGAAATDMLPLDLTLGQARQALEMVAAAATAGRRTSGTGERGLGGFREAWLEYVQLLERGS